MTAHILVPVDASAPARAALEYACEQFPDARLTLLYVVDPMVGLQPPALDGAVLR